MWAILRPKLESSAVLDESKEGDAQDTEIEVIQQPARLLNLPAEIRNEIWQYLLVQVSIDITANDHHEPHLLHTCHQVREEASAIFLDNTFWVDIHARKFAPQPRHWLWTRVPQANVKVWFKDYKTVSHGRWSNLKAWLQQYHNGVALGVAVPHTAQGPHASQHGKDINQVFSIVKSLKDAEWPAVDAALESFKSNTYGHVRIRGDRCFFVD